jgi:hypothetical protein
MGSATPGQRRFATRNPPVGDLTRTSHAIRPRQHSALCLGDHRGLTPARCQRTPRRGLRTNDLGPMQVAEPRGTRHVRILCCYRFAHTQACGSPTSKLPFTHLLDRRCVRLEVDPMARYLPRCALQLSAMGVNIAGDPATSCRVVGAGVRRRRNIRGTGLALC